MSLTFSVGPANGGPPVGNYRAVFQGVESVPENKEKNYGAGVRFTWRVTDGPHVGKLASRVTPAKVSETNVTGKLLACLVGRPIKEGESINPADFVGRSYLLVVAQGQGGGTRVESAIAV